MNNKFLELWKEWHNAIDFLSIDLGPDEPHWQRLVEWSLENKDEATESIKEILLEEPDGVVRILETLYGKRYTGEHHISLDTYCSVWLSELTGETKDYYKDWRGWQEYLKNNYIPWNPLKEDDPNPTLEEWKKG